MIKAVSLSRIGMKSSCNEDAFLALPTDGIFAVADGVGGQPKGEKASRMTVETLYIKLRSQLIEAADIDQSIEKANSLVYNSSMQYDLERGMASTLALARIEKERVLCYNVGDSRIYRVRENVITQLTKDHVKRVHRQHGVKSLVTRAIGAGKRVLPDITEWDWKENDFLVLMTDGISNQLSDEAIKDIVSSQSLHLADKAETLIAESEKSGGKDDKTVVMIFNEGP